MANSSGGGSGGGKMRNRRAYQPKGPAYSIPPRLIGESIKLYRFTLGNIAVFVLAGFAFIGYLVFIPIPDFFSVKLVIAGALAAGIIAYFIFPFGGGLTGLEWTVTIIDFKRSNIPRHTRARPLSLNGANNFSYFAALNPERTKEISSSTGIIGLNAETAEANYPDGEGVNVADGETLDTAIADADAGAPLPVVVQQGLGQEAQL